MLQYFFDTSALVKRYHQEQGSAHVGEIFAAPQNLVRISTLGAVEIHSAFAVKARVGQLTRTAAQTLADGVPGNLTLDQVATEMGLAVVNPVRSAA